MRPAGAPGWVTSLARHYRGGCSPLFYVQPAAGRETHTGTERELHWEPMVALRPPLQDGTLPKTRPWQPPFPVRVNPTVEDRQPAYSMGVPS